MTRLIVLRDGTGRQVEHLLAHAVPVVRVPVWMEGGFGSVEFVHDGRHTVAGFPLYEASGQVFQYDDRLWREPREVVT